MKDADPAPTQEGGVLPPSSELPVADVAAAQNPGRGGRYVRDPKSGALIRVQHTETCVDCVLKSGKKE